MKIETNGMIKEAWKDDAGNVIYDLSRPKRTKRIAECHPVIEHLGIVPVFREDKVDGQDIATITYEEAVLLADRIIKHEVLIEQIKAVMEWHQIRDNS